jgi:hypothetical protein
MRTTMNNFAMIPSWIRSGLIALALALPCLSFSTGCSQVEGSRCNSALSHNECDNPSTITCFAPAASACNGEAYCCALDSNGIVTSNDPNCQFLVMCQAASLDAGTTPTPDAGGDDGG